jgi:hypothetical protein
MGPSPFRRCLRELLDLSPDDVARGAGGIAEGMAATRSGRRIAKFAEGGLLVVHAGGGAGLFSSIIAGWTSGPAGSQPVTTEVTR